MGKMTVCKTCEKEVAKSAKICPHCGAKLKGGKLKFVIGGFIALIIIIIIFAISGGNSNSNKNIDLVKNGYLGDYNTVTISKVIDTNFKNADIKWDNFQSKGKDIVEVKINDKAINKTMLIQFSVNSDDTFEVVHLNVGGQAFDEPYDVKLLLDGLYDTYAQTTNDKSIKVNTDTSNDTLKGRKVASQSQSKSEPKNQNTVASNTSQNTQETKKEVELLSYIGASIDKIKKDLGAPNKISGVQSSELYDYGTFSFVINDGKATTIELKGSGATANGIGIGMLPKEIISKNGKPTRECGNNEYALQYSLSNDAILIEYSSKDSSSPVNLITIVDSTYNEQ